MKIPGSSRKVNLTVIFLLFGSFAIFVGSAIGSSGESSGGGVTVTPDWSVLLQIVNFLFLIWVLNLILYRPIRKILIQRRQKIEGLELSIETSNRDSQEKDAAFAVGIKEARAKGLKEKEALMEEASDAEKQIVADLNKKAQAELVEIHGKIAKDVEKAKESLQKEIAVFANDIGQKILGRAV